MKWVPLVFLVASSSFAVCDIPAALQSLSPGSEWVVLGTDYSGIQWLNPSQPEPTLDQVNAAIAACQADQIQLQAYRVELSTTTAAVVALGNGYVAANAISQAQYNAKVVRIIQLRAFLGLQ